MVNLLKLAYSKLLEINRARQTDIHEKKSETAPNQRVYGSGVCVDGSPTSKEKSTR
jgi:hypothetical protein